MQTYEITGTHTVDERTLFTCRPVNTPYNLRGLYTLTGDLSCLQVIILVTTEGSAVVTREQAFALLSRPDLLNEIRNQYSSEAEVRAAAQEVGITLSPFQHIGEQEWGIADVK